MYYVTIEGRGGLSHTEHFSVEAGSVAIALRIVSAYILGCWDRASTVYEITELRSSPKRKTEYRKL